jgi:uncharacterized protein (DUF1501 family)
MAMTRRQFVKRTGLATAATFLGPSFFRNPFLQQALAATDKYLVVFFLDGGNDGLNTVAPADNGLVGPGGLRDAYEAARGGNTGAGGIRLLDTDLLKPATFVDENTGSQLGFHPGLQGFRSLYNLGKLAVVQGCGYPKPNLSHDESRHKWQTGDPLDALSNTYGWVGRYLAANYGGNDIPGVCIRSEVAPELDQRTTSVLAVRRLNDFSFPYDSHHMPGETQSDENGKKDTAFTALYNNAAASTLQAVQYVANTGNVTLRASTKYRQLSNLYTMDRPSWNTQYGNLNTSSARDLREVAKVIYGVATGFDPTTVNARFFEVSNGGYDTHSDQGAAAPNGQHYGILAEIGNAIELFYHDVEDMQPGLADKLCVLVWSEFSRRIPQNDNGTDHGSQGPVFLIGGKLNAGAYGNHPNIALSALDNDGNTKYSQDPGNGFRSTDLRDVYGTVLKHWLGVANPSTLLPVDSGDPNKFWTVPDYDLANAAGPLFQP